jgi:murein DD-endopeptidase MepM/ murein hydrolase activator NlpD
VTPIPALAAPPDQPPPPGDRPPVETSPEAPPPQSLPQAPEEPATPPPTPAPGPPLPGLPPLVPPSAPGLRVFPVAGPASFVDDYGAPRAGTGWHHGNDIFADRNTPVVAVADGTLSLVGVNPLGGNRLWLTDDTGTSYYYAHLQGYAPVAVDGARVRAGEILGYVGNTGQAVTTPTHLHFEVHPDGGDSVDPYPYLVAWENNTDLSGQSPFEVQSQSAGAVLIGAVQQVDAPAPGDGLAHAVS